MRLWPRYPDGERIEVWLLASNVWWVAKHRRHGFRYEWRSGYIVGPPMQGPRPHGSESKDVAA